MEPIYARNPDGEPLPIDYEVWKYLLSPDTQSVEMPAGAKPLSAQFQDDRLVLWCLVCPTAPRRRVWACVVGTGRPLTLTARWQYVSTVQEPGTPLVWHVFFDGGDL